MNSNQFKNNQALVSVIIPSYNNEKSINECIESLLRQNYENFEIIIIDDGSTDETYNIETKISEKNNKIQVFQIQHSGVSKARNYGLQKVIGKYIMFCDADDSVCNDWISKMVENNCDYSLCSYNNHRICKESWVKKFEDCISWILDNYLYTCRSVCTKCFRADIIKKNNIHFDEELYCYEDGLFVLEYMLCLNKDARVKYVNENLYNYNVTEKGAHIKLNEQQENLHYKKMKQCINKSNTNKELKKLFNDYAANSYYYFKMTRLVRESKASEVSKLIKSNRNVLNFRNLKYVSRLRERIFVALGSGKLYCWAYKRFNK